MKKKRTYRVDYQGNTHTVYSCSSPQAACRLAFRAWIKQRVIKRQPPSILGGFKDVAVTILEG